MLLSQELLGRPIYGVALNQKGEIYISLVNSVARVNPSDGTWTTVVGDATDTSHGVPAIAAQLAATRLVFDSVGRLLLSTDTGVFRIDFAAVTLTKIAGTGTAGFSGDGGPATQAQLNTPKGMAFDSAGNLFIADSGNFRVRRVDAQTGTINTVLGGWPPGYVGSIGNPFDVAVAPNGNLLVASPSVPQIIQMDSSGFISVYAGNGASYTLPSGDGGPPGGATFCNPTILRFDSQGNLFIGDGEHLTAPPLHGVYCGGGIRRVDAHTGLIQTLVTDYNGPDVRPDGTLAQLNLIESMADFAVSNGNLYVASYSQGTLYKVSPVDAPLPSPGPNVTAILDAASLGPAGFYPGEIISIVGNYFGPSTPASLTLGSDGLVTTTLGGVQMFLAKIPSPLLYVSAGQINAVVPYASPVHLQSKLRLETPSGEYLYSYNGLPAGPSVFQGAVVNPDGSLNSADHPAPQGSTLVFYGTGLGQTKPATVDGAVYSGPDFPVSTGTVEVLFAKQGGQVLYAGQAPDLVAGAMQVNAQLPPNLPGIVPVDIFVDGSYSPFAPSPVTQVYVEQSVPSPVISNVVVAYANPDLVASVALRGLLITGTGFAPDAVVELYFNGGRIATLNRDPSVYPVNSPTSLYSNLNFGGIPGAYEVDVLNSPNIRSARYSVSVLPTNTP
jgi:uncharacterized protein (TIGR03437 family)